jgi:tyrosine decarboxylase/aspartate 1-decarboxylase
MRENGIPADEVRTALRAARARDVPFASGRILGSMCTAPHPIGVEAYHTFLETNLGDPQLAPGAKELETRALAALGHLLHAPPTARGVFLTGGSEANFMGILLAHRRKGGREVILPESAHFSFDKAMNYLGLRPVSARVGPEGTIDLDDVRARIGRDTCCLVGIAGTTELGVVDDIPALAALGADMDLPVHVDAAFGGFVIPFAKRLGRALPDFDLTVPGVSTVAIDPHKMGMAPIPSGVLFARDGRDFDAVSVSSPYVSVERQPSLQGTRPGAAPAAAWAVMEHLGLTGYTEVVHRCLTTTKRLADGLRRRGFPLVIDPVLNIVAFRVDDPVAARAALRKRGYLLSLAPLSKGLKVVVMPHVTDAAVDAFLDVLPQVVAPPSEAGVNG